MSLIKAKAACEAKHCRAFKMTLEKETERVSRMNKPLGEKLKELTKMMFDHKIDKKTWSEKYQVILAGMKTNEGTIPDKVFDDVNKCLTQMCKKETEAFVTFAMDLAKEACATMTAKERQKRIICRQHRAMSNKMKTGIIPAYYGIHKNVTQR